MTTLLDCIDGAASALGKVIAADLREHRGSAFRALPAEAVEQHVARMLAALRSDVAAGGIDHARRALQALLRDVQPLPMGFHDMRLLARALRAHLLAAAEGAPALEPGAVRRLEDVLFELSLQISLQLIARREEVIVAQATELECQLATARDASAEHARTTERLDALIASIPGIVFESWGKEDPSEYQSNFASDRIAEFSGYTREEWLAQPDLWLKTIHPEDRARVLADNETIFAEGRGVVQYRFFTKDGRIVWAESHQVTIYDAGGRPIGARGVVLDVTARKLAEQTEAELREQMMRLQEEKLTELSTPLIPISDKVLVMPLVGSIDPARAERIITTLLDGIGKTRARFAILDITGVPKVDAEIAATIVRAARAVQLLGAEVVLTGIRPEVAQTLVSVGADLGGIATLGTLASGIAYAAAARR